MFIKAKITESTNALDIVSETLLPLASEVLNSSDTISVTGIYNVEVTEVATAIDYVSFPAKMKIWTGSFWREVN